MVVSARCSFVISALLAALAAGPACGATHASTPRPPKDPAAAARGYLKALKTEKGSKVCPLVTQATKRAFIDEARNDGLRVTHCEAAADHDLYNVGRVLGSFHIIRVVVHGRLAYTTVSDAPVSDSGNDTFLLRKQRDRRWLVDDS